MNLTKPAAVALQIIGAGILIVSLFALLITSEGIAIVGVIAGGVLMFMGHPKKSS